MTTFKTKSSFLKILNFVNLKHIPGPRGFFFLNYVRSFQKDILKSFVKVHKDYNSIASFPWPMNSIIIYSPEYSKSVLVENSKNFIKGEQTDEVRAIIGNSIATNADFDSWAKSRSLLSKEFNFKTVNQFIESFHEISKKYLEFDSQDLALLDIEKEMKFLTFEIASKTLLGASITKLHAEQVNAAVDFTSIVVYKRVFQLFPLPYWVPTPTHIKFKKHINHLDQIVYSLIKKEQQNPNSNGKSVLERLVHAKDEETKFSFSNTELRDEVLTMLIAGHETTASTLTWAFGLLAKHPEIQEKLFIQIKKNQHLPMSELIEAIPYLRWIINETMRLYPAFPVISRKVESSTKLGDYEIPKNTNVVIPLYVIQRNEQNWKYAADFNPERFSNKESEKSSAFMPFGRGPRRCIAELFAMTEISIIIINLISKYEVKLVNADLPKEVASVSLRPEGGLLLKLTKRDSAS